MKTYQDRPRPIYEIRVQGELDRGWEEWFDARTVSLTSAGGRTPATILVAHLADQAALRGLLCKLWDLNLTLVSVRSIEADGKKEETDG